MEAFGDQVEADLDESHACFWLAVHPQAWRLGLQPIHVLSFSINAPQLTRSQVPVWSRWLGGFSVAPSAFAMSGFTLSGPCVTRLSFSFILWWLRCWACVWILNRQLVKAKPSLSVPGLVSRGFLRGILKTSSWALRFCRAFFRLCSSPLDSCINRIHWWLCAWLLRVFILFCLFVISDFFF